MQELEDRIFSIKFPAWSNLNLVVFKLHFFFLEKKKGNLMPKKCITSAFKREDLEFDLREKIDCWGEEKITIPSFPSWMISQKKIFKYPYHIRIRKTRKSWCYTSYVPRSEYHIREHTFICRLDPKDKPYLDERLYAPEHIGTMVYTWKSCLKHIY